MSIAIGMLGKIDAFDFFINPCADLSILFMQLS